MKKLHRMQHSTERIYEVKGHQEHVVKANEHLIEYWKDDTENGCG